MPKDAVVPLREADRRLGQSPRSTRYDIALGRLRAFKRGDRAYGVSERSLEALLEARLAPHPDLETVKNLVKELSPEEQRILARHLRSAP